jgi:tRNA A-37 threonylcarbamoyl transferase component Bud32
MGFLWRLDTTSGSWAVKELFDRAGDADLGVEVRLVERARRAGVRAPSVVRTNSGEIVLEAECYPARRVFLRA